MSAAPRPREAVYRALKRCILLNELSPAAPLTELGIAEAMGCSQGTVREALLRLQEDGLVQRAGHRGTSVTPLDGDSAGEMLALRRLIETRAAPRAAAALTIEARAGFVATLSEMEAAARAGDAYGVMLLDIDFHMALFRLSGRAALEQILLRAMLHSHRHKLWEPRHGRPLLETARRHRDIITALDAGGEALSAALGIHIDTIVEIAPHRIAS
jgi:DNA-binding GntR family transcriptional regulator